MKLTKVAQRYLRQLDFKLHQARLSLHTSGHSNLNEEAILQKYIDELLPPDHSRTAVDLGAGDGTRWSNTYALFQNGWKGVGVEYDSHRAVKLAKAYKYYPEVFACRCRVTPYNIVPLLQAYSIEKDFSVLNLDIDSYDYWVLDEILTHFRPRLVVTEINEKIPPPIKFIVRYDPDFTLTHHFYGYSIASLAELCEQHDYALIELEYNNAFLAPREMPGVRPLEAETAYRQGYLERPDRKEKFALNEDMEILHSLSAEEAVEFLNRFFARHQGKYELSINRTAPIQTVHH